MLYLNQVILIVVYLTLIHGYAFRRSPIGQRIDETLLGGDRLHQMFGNQGSAGYQKNNNQDLISAKDGGFYKEADNVRNLHDVSNLAKGQSFNVNQNSQGQDLHNNEEHNKNEKKSGFHNTYHKDESGSNSEYYEDSTDNGGHLLYNNERNNRGRGDNRRYYDDFQDGGHRLRGNERDGAYGITRGSGAEHGRVGSFDRGDNYGNSNLLNKKHLQTEYDYDDYPGYYRSPYYSRYGYPHHGFYRNFGGRYNYPSRFGGYGGSRGFYEDDFIFRGSPHQEYRSPVRYSGYDEYPAHLETHDGRYRY